MSGSSHEGGDRLVGQVIADRYQILELLGEGGMGRVYLAEHVRMGRKSAIKVMSPNLALSADAISRFNREAANASRINHPNVAQIYDFGETSDGLLYLAMELVEGETLRTLIARGGPLSFARAADIAKQVADALAAAHHLGIVHRDLKPDNVMIAKHHDGTDWVKVVDFGIAKTVQGSGESGGGSQTVTTAGVSLGTPEYMSPEQLAGERLDNRTDLYSLGLVLFNMLTADLPYPRVTSKETLVRRLTARPRTLADVAPTMPWPPALQAALDRALAPETADRYATVTDFARDVLDATASAAARPSAPTQRIAVPPPKRTRPLPVDTHRARRRVLATAGALLVVLAVGAGAIVANRARHESVAVPKPANPVPLPAPSTPANVSPSAPTQTAKASPPPPPATPKTSPTPPPSTAASPTSAPVASVESVALVASTQPAPAPNTDSSASAFASAAARRHGRFNRSWLRANGDSTSSGSAAPASDADRVRLLVDEIRGHLMRANQSLQRADVPHVRSEFRDLSGDAKMLTELYPSAAESLHVRQVIAAYGRRMIVQTCPAALADSTKHFPPSFTCDQLLPGFARGRQAGGQGRRGQGGGGSGGAFNRPPRY